MPPPTKLNSSSFLLFACYCLQLSQLSNGYRGHKLRTHSFSSHFYEAWQCGWCQWLLLGLQFVVLIGSPVIIMLILLQTKLFMQTKLRKQCTALSVVAGANVNYKLTVGVKWVSSYNFHNKHSTTCPQCSDSVTRITPPLQSQCFSAKKMSTRIKFNTITRQSSSSELDNIKLCNTHYNLYHCYNH